MQYAAEPCAKKTTQVSFGRESAPALIWQRIVGLSRYCVLAAKLSAIQKVMIEIAGSTQRSFVFPARREDAFSFYQDIEHTFRFLPHISIARSYADGQYRLLYSAVETGMYRVEIFCDVLATADEGHHLIDISPLPGHAPEKSKAGFHSMTGQGYYTSKCRFRERGEQTTIEFSIELSARLPVPITLRWIPHDLLDGIAQNRLQLHMDEIIASFVEQSTRSFRGR